jgi:predicted AlkP superfamily pyrophosphatase or phosphodiesterase
VILALLLVGCQPGPPPTEGPVNNSATTSPSATTTPAPTGAADDPIDRILAISVDGLNPQAIHQLGPSRTPAFHRLIREGATTLNARTAHEETNTLPNHTGMLTGLRVDDRHGGHGVTFNDDNGSTGHGAAGRYVASMFDVVHDHGGSTALFTAKEKFALYQRTWNTHGAQDRTDADNGRAKIDRFAIACNDTSLVATLTAELRGSPRDLTFLHLSQPDQTGHDHDFMSQRYLTAVHDTDQLLGHILDTIAADPTLRSHTLVLLTADHGGQGESHSDPTQLANYRIPFMAWGPGITAGRDLYRINPAYRNPGTARTNYHNTQPIRNGDLANLVTDVLDLPPVPGSQLNRRHTLNVFG